MNTDRSLQSDFFKVEPNQKSLWSPVFYRQEVLEVLSRGKENLPFSFPFPIWVNAPPPSKLTDGAFRLMPALPPPSSLAAVPGQRPWLGKGCLFWQQQHQHQWRQHWLPEAKPGGGLGPRVYTQEQEVLLGAWAPPSIDGAGWSWALGQSCLIAIEPLIQSQAPTCVRGRGASGAGAVRWAVGVSVARAYQLTPFSPSARWPGGRRWRKVGKPGPRPRPLPPRSGTVPVSQVEHQPQVGSRQVQWRRGRDRGRREWAREQRRQGCPPTRGGVGAAGDMRTGGVGCLWSWLASWVFSCYLVSHWPWRMIELCPLFLAIIFVFFKCGDRDE